MKEYRIGNMYYEGKLHYHIERKVNNGEWKLLFGGLSYQEADFFINNPIEIEKFNTYLKRVSYGVLIFFIFLVLFLYLKC